MLLISQNASVFFTPLLTETVEIDRTRGKESRGMMTAVCNQENWILWLKHERWTWTTSVLLIQTEDANMLTSLWVDPPRSAATVLSWLTAEQTSVAAAALSVCVLILLNEASCRPSELLFSCSSNVWSWPTPPPTHRLKHTSCWSDRLSTGGVDLLLLLLLLHKLTSFSFVCFQPRHSQPFSFSSSIPTLTGLYSM